MTLHLITADTETQTGQEWSRTVLGEFGGGQLGGDPERLLAAALEDEAGRNAGTEVVVVPGAGQPQVQRRVTERGVLVTLRRKKTQRTSDNPSTYKHIYVLRDDTSEDAAPPVHLRHEQRDTL